MNCAFDKEKLSGYYDGELDAAEKAEVERHIASCSECLRELGELKSSALLVKELPRLRAPRSISEGVTREILAAGKVHQFAKVRRNVLWAAAAAAGILVILNVAYFTRMERSASDPTVAAKQAGVPSIASVPAPADMPAAKQEDALRRAALDPVAKERERAFAPEEQKKLADAKEESRKRDEADRQKSAEPERPAPAPEPKPAAARVAEPGKPSASPALPPAPPAAVPPAPKPAPAALAGGKDDARPAEAPAAEKAAASKPEPMAKDSDPKAKRFGEPQGEAPPTHLTLASTQLAKARPVMEDTLRKMGVKLPSAPSAPVKGMAGKSGPTESALTLELTESQIARLRQELEKSGHSRLVAASPGDPVLQQFGDTGLYRATRKDVASGGAGVKKAAEVPKADVAKAEPSKTAPETKEADREKDGKEAGESLNKANLEGAADKSQEPKRKIILHLLDVPFMPDQQPAPDPVKK